MLPPSGLPKHLGENGIDDGGKPQPTLSRQKQLDWVWEIP